MGSREARPPMYIPVLGELSNREWIVLREALKGEGNKAVAYKLGVSEQTIKNQLSDAYRKLGVDTLLEAGWASGLLIAAGPEAEIEHTRARRLAKLHEMYQFLANEAQLMADLMEQEDPRPPRGVAAEGPQAT